MVEDQFYILGSYYERKNKESNLVAVGVSASGQLNKKQITLFSNQTEKHAERGGYYFKNSYEEDKLLAMHVSYIKKEDKIKYEIKLFDKDLNTLMEQNEESVADNNQSDLQFGIEDYDVSPYGDVYLVINQGYRDRKLKKRIEKFEVHAFKKENGYTKEIINLDVSGNSILNCKMAIDNDNVIQLIGFYAETSQKGRSENDLKGIYNFNINGVNNKVDNVKFNEFDYDTKVKILGERRANKGKDLKPFYRIHSFISRADGGLTILSEYQLAIIGQSSGIGPLAFTPITYVSNEIIVTSLSPTGELEWGNVVPKEQKVSTTVMSIAFGFGVANGNVTVGSSFVIPITEMGKGPEYISAIPIYQNGVLSVLYNDNPKNQGETDIDEIKQMSRYNKSIPTVFQFENDGTIKRIDSEKAINDEVIIRPGVYYRKSQDEYIIFASKRSEEKLGRMIIN